MNSEKNPSSPREPNAEGGRAAAEDGVPLSVRKAGEMRTALWPYCWMSFASVILLAAALAILTYRMGVQSCH